MGKSINPIEVWLAGASGSEGSKHFRLRVYPRACGGTHASKASTLARSGLSPRVRGNRQNFASNFSPLYRNMGEQIAAAVRVQNTFVNHSVGSRFRPSRGRGG